MYISEVVTFFPSLAVIQSTQFLAAVHVYEIHIFDEAFLLLTIRMPMATKPFRVVTCCEELSPIAMHGTSMEWFCGVM